MRLVMPVYKYFTKQQMKNPSSTFSIKTNVQHHHFLVPLYSVLPLNKIGQFLSLQNKTEKVLTEKQINCNVIPHWLY